MERSVFPQDIPRDYRNRGLKFLELCCQVVTKLYSSKPKFK